VNIAKPGSKKIEKIPVFANNGNKVYTLLRRTWTELADLVLAWTLFSHKYKAKIVPNKGWLFAK